MDFAFVTDAVGLVAGVMSLLIMAGAVGVLFYRVKQSEVAHQENENEIAECHKCADAFHLEVTTAIARMETDVKWIKTRLENGGPV